MIHLRVVADEICDFFRIDDPADVMNKLVGKFLFDSIDQGCFLIQYKIGVVGGPGFGQIP